MFSTLASFESWYCHFEDRWPSLDDYQCLLEQQSPPVMTRNGSALNIVSQAGKPRSFKEHYAPRIYQYGEIQTRTENWHDFFQLLTWIMFPRTKALINEIHIPLAQGRIESAIETETRINSGIGAGAELGRRTPLENMLSLFDEGGAVVISSDASLLQLIREFQWKTLFWQQRKALRQHLNCIVFGHAMYEKGLEPYIGMTANTILLQCEEELFHCSNSEQLAWIDDALATVIADRERLSVPKDLAPFPLLGMPGWDVNNSDKGYYDNRYYFRPGRRCANA